MTLELRYGASNSIKLLTTERQTVRACSIAIPAIEDSLEQTLHTSLDKSIHFPAFKEIVFPEDTLAIAVGEGIPQTAQILQSLLDYIQKHTALSPNDITIVFANSTEAIAQNELQTLLDEFLFASLEFEVHNPDIPEELAYLTATLEGEPIRLNKTLVDADVVLPICTNLPNSIFGYAGFFHDLFPLYTETDTILRLRSKQNAEELTRDAGEAAGMLGVQYLIKVTPGNANAIHNITAGDTHSLQSAITAIANDVWNHPTNQAEISIGSISGSPTQQTWDNLARAYSALAKTTSPGGSIVLCTNIDGPLPGVIQLLSSNDATQNLHEQLKQHPEVDVQTAAEILRLRSEYHLYLLSHLNHDDVESIGLAHIESPDQINNLIQSAETINCVGDAHRSAFH